MVATYTTGTLVRDDGIGRVAIIFDGDGLPAIWVAVAQRTHHANWQGDDVVLRTVVGNPARALPNGVMGEVACTRGARCAFTGVSNTNRGDEAGLDWNCSTALSRGGGCGRSCGRCDRSWGRWRDVSGCSRSGGRGRGGGRLNVGSAGRRR